MIMEVWIPAEVQFSFYEALRVGCGFTGTCQKVELYFTLGGWNVDLFLLTLFGENGICNTTSSHSNNDPPEYCSNILGFIILFSNEKE